jgi:hypothetical protein
VTIWQSQFVVRCESVPLHGVDHGTVRGFPNVILEQSRTDGVGFLFADSWPATTWSCAAENLREWSARVWS